MQVPRTAIVSTVLAISGKIGGCAISPKTDSQAVPATVSSQALSAPPMQVGFDPVTIHLGPLPWHSSTPFLLDFVNGGETPVKIAALRPSCGCTEMSPAEYAGRVIPAGKTLQIEGVLETEAALGRQQRRVDLLLENGAVHTAFIEHTTFATYEITPRSLDFGYIDLADDDGDFLETFVVRSGSARVMDITPDVAWLQTAFQETGAGETAVRIRFRPDFATIGEHTGIIRVHLDDPHRPTTTVAARVNCDAALRPKPAHLFLYPGATQTFSVFDREGRLTRVRDANELIAEMHIVELPESRISVTASPDAQTGTRILTFGTDSGDIARIAVSIVEPGNGGS